MARVKKSGKRYRQRPCAGIVIDPHVKPVEDLMGRQFGRWVVTGYFGKRITTSATHVNAKGEPVRNSSELWVCTCECGRVCNVSRSNLIPKKGSAKGRSTQCVSCQTAAQSVPQELKTARRHVWRRVKATQTWGSWENFRTWDVQQDKQPGQRLLRKNTALPHGPDNSFYGTEAPQYAADIALLAEVDGVSVEAMRAHYSTKTRQAVSQAAKAVRHRMGELG